MSSRARMRWSSGRESDWSPITTAPRMRSSPRISRRWSAPRVGRHGEAVELLAPGVAVAAGEGHEVAVATAGADRADQRRRHPADLGHVERRRAGHVATRSRPPCWPRRPGPARSRPTTGCRCRAARSPGRAPRRRRRPRRCRGRVVASVSSVKMPRPVSRPICCASSSRGLRAHRHRQHVARRCARRPSSRSPTTRFLCPITRASSMLRWITIAVVLRGAPRPAPTRARSSTLAQ